MKKLEFNDVEQYELLYEGLVSSATRGPETRVLGKVLDKLEQIGVKKATDGLLYTLATSEQPVELEDAEFELAKRLLNSIEWRGTAAKRFAELMDWLDSVR